MLDMFNSPLFWIVIYLSGIVFSFGFMKGTFYKEFPLVSRSLVDDLIILLFSIGSWYSAFCVFLFSYRFIGFRFRIPSSKIEESPKQIEESPEQIEVYNDLVKEQKANLTGPDGNWASYTMFNILYFLENVIIWDRNKANKYRYYALVKLACNYINESGDQTALSDLKERIVEDSRYFTPNESSELNNYFTKQITAEG